MKQTDISIGVDQGGTKLLIGAVRRDGSILAQRTFPTGFVDQHQTARAIYAGLESFLSDGFPDAGTAVGIGMGIVGQIDGINGEWTKMYNLESDSPIPICAEITRRFGLPCRIDNDVKTAMQAVRALELAGCENFAYLNIGTGISAGIVVDNHLLRGCRNNAGEIGQYIVRLPNGTVTSVEDVASGGGMLRCARAWAADYPNDPAAEATHAGELYRLADAGSPLAMRITDIAASAIADLIVGVMATCAPECVVLGGGAMRTRWMFDKVVARMPKTAYCDDTVIRLCALDLSTLGLIGAGMLGFDAAMPRG